jgi:hypothetical protein
VISPSLTNAPSDALGHGQGVVGEHWVELVHVLMIVLGHSPMGGSWTCASVDATRCVRVNASGWCDRRVMVSVLHGTTVCSPLSLANASNHLIASHLLTEQGRWLSPQSACVTSLAQCLSMLCKLP